MRLVVRLLGVEVLAVETGMGEDLADVGDCTTYPVGFVASPVDRLPSLEGAE